MGIAPSKAEAEAIDKANLNGMFALFRRGKNQERIDGYHLPVQAMRQVAIRGSKENWKKVQTALLTIGAITFTTWSRQKLSPQGIR